MTPPLPNPSSRLVRAAAAEFTEVQRARQRIVDERESLVAELRRIEEMLAEADERLDVLRRLAPDAVGASRSEEPEASTAREPLQDDTKMLRGPEIRQVAVKTLVRQSPGLNALHYRAWYELVTAAGYSVEGKDPLAVFLTQLSRSPVVRRSTSAGVYELDYSAADRLKNRLESLHAELRNITLTPDEPADLPKIRARRRSLDVEIAQVERALEEALAVLPPDASVVALRGEAAEA